MKTAEHKSPTVQWAFLQHKKRNNAGRNPPHVFLHSTTQIGSKFLVYGGCDSVGRVSDELFLYDSALYTWSFLSSAFREDHAGARYGHSATLIEMHPPKILVWGGLVDGGTFEFDAPDSMDEDSSNNSRVYHNISMRRKGKQKNCSEDLDEGVYILNFSGETMTWTKPLIRAQANCKPVPRTEHSVCKTRTNEVTIFGGWSGGPLNDLWTFNYVDMEWKECVTSGIKPRPRYGHTSEILGTKMYILGGCDNDNDDCADYLGIHELCLETMKWSHPQLKVFGGHDCSPFPRTGHCSAVVGAYTIAIFGGRLCNEIYYNDLYLIDTKTFIVTLVNALAKSLPVPVSGVTLCTTGSRLFVFGGVDLQGECYNDIRTVDIDHYLDDSDISVREGSSSDYNLKILIIGDASVGKSALLTRFAENVFLYHYQSTIGIDYNTRLIRVEKAICKLEIWDTAGQERFSTITANYYRGAQGALIVYDITSRESFAHARNWFERAKMLGGQEMEAILVGNKTDLDDADVGGRARAVTYDEGVQLAELLGVPFIETSALSGNNVDGAFVRMTADIKRSIDRRGLKGVKTNSKGAGGVQLTSGEKKDGMMGKCGCRSFF